MYHGPKFNLKTEQSGVQTSPGVDLEKKTQHSYYSN